MRNRVWSGLLGVLAIGGLAAAVADDERESPPSAFSPFEHLIGGWKGQGIPAKNRLRGWPEKHMWAWKFVKGKPVGLSLEIVGGKYLKAAQLKHDAKTGAYTLEGTDPDDKPIAFSGKLDDETHMLVMDRLNPPADVGKERLDLALNQNKIRYTMRLFRREPDAPQYALQFDAGMTKEGEAFAAGGAAADLPKCVITGGAAGLSVVYKGVNYPLCCTGCRDEFNDNPEKWVKKIALRKEKGDAAPLKTTSAGPADTPGSAKDTTPAKAMPKPAAPKAKTAPSTAKAETKPAEKTDLAAKAASVLALGQALEKSGKTQAALTYYRRIVKEFPDTPAAKTANAKIKALASK